jgi:hypothetical protein
MRSPWQPSGLNLTGLPHTPIEQHHGFGRTPIERVLLKWGVIPGPPPPRHGSVQLRVQVRDANGLDCEGAKYPLLALRGMAASVWVTHETQGYLQLTDNGKDTRGLNIAPRFHKGDELTLTATGPDAERALEACRVLLEAPLENRKDLYRRHYRKEST